MISTPDSYSSVGRRKGKASSSHQQSTPASHVHANSHSTSATTLPASSFFTPPSATGSFQSPPPNSQPKSNQHLLSTPLTTTGASLSFSDYSARSDQSSFDRYKLARQEKNARNATTTKNSNHISPFASLSLSSALSSTTPTNPLSHSFLRSLTHKSLNAHLYTQAIFYADKLCSLCKSTQSPPIPFPSSPFSPSVSSSTLHPPLADIYLLADCYYRNGEYRRAIHALRNRTTLFSAAGGETARTSVGGGAIDEAFTYIEEGEDEDETQEYPIDTEMRNFDNHKEDGYKQTNTDHVTPIINNKQSSRTQSHSFTHHRTLLVLRIWYLAMRCLFAIKEYDECLLVLGGDEDIVKSNITRLTEYLDNGQQSSDETEVNLCSAASCLRGEVYEMLENRARAIYWFKLAVTIDVKCIQAFEKLIDKRMLSFEAEHEFLSNLIFPPSLTWLKLLYENKLDAYDPNDHIASKEEQQRLLHSTALIATINSSISHHPRILVRLSILTSNYGVLDNVDAYSSVVTHLYTKGDYTAAMNLSVRLLSVDPFITSVLLIHISCLLETGKKSDLFYIAHQLVQEKPGAAISWFAVGAYYYCIGKYDISRKFFNKSTTLDPFYSPAWLGFGHTFAAQDESDQAMMAYRTAARLFEGSHLPLLSIGMEYVRTNNLTLAIQFFMQSNKLYPYDPLTWNEIGVVKYKEGEWKESVELFLKCLKLVSSPYAIQYVMESPEDKQSSEFKHSTTSFPPLSSSTPPTTWESVWSNLGHGLRKMGSYSRAVRAYEQALNPAAFHAHHVNIINMNGKEEKEKEEKKDYNNNGSSTSTDIEMKWENNYNTQDEYNSYSPSTKTLPSPTPPPAGSTTHPISTSAAIGAATSSNNRQFRKSIYTSMGFTYHLMGHLPLAIHYYHQALGLSPRDSFTLELLSEALEESAGEK